MTKASFKVAKYTCIGEVVKVNIYTTWVRINAPQWVIDEARFKNHSIQRLGVIKRHNKKHHVKFYGE